MGVGQPIATRPALVLAALAIMLGLAGSASAKVRAVFVGVDTYAFTNADDGFYDLKGTVNDVTHIKAALQAVYGWDLDQPVAGQCRSASAVSITLTNACATRAAILGAIAQQVQSSAPGDTVIFYYAGHGSQIIDSQHFNEPSGANDTILPYDARDPGETVPTEILDEEFNVIIENARNVAGVNVVTIFDSCHSATGVRGMSDGQPREVNSAVLGQGLIATRRPLSPLSPPRVTTPGYRVHLAAAGDSETAMETSVDGNAPPSGVFTTALVEAINTLPGASFADLIEETRRQIEAHGRDSQHPAAEGALTEGFGGGGSAALLLAATPGHGGATLTAGALSGMTRLSRFALFANWTDARDNRQPLAAGYISAVTADSATVKLDARPRAPLPAQLVARETAHVFGNLAVNVRVDLPDDGTGGRKRVIDAVNATRFAKVAEPAEILIMTYGSGKGPVLVFTTDGGGVASLPPMADPALPATLTGTLAMRARVDALLALRTDPAGAQLVTCIDNAPFFISNGIVCPALARATPQKVLQPQQRALLASRPIHFAVQNTARAPRFVYVFMIGDDSTITLLTPQDAPLPPDRVQMITFVVDTPGQKRFLVLATDDKHPINATVLEQGKGARDVASCTGTLEKLLCQAASGRRDPATARAGSWSAIVTTATVKRPDELSARDP